MRKRLIPWCGSTDPEHRVMRCHECQRIRMKDYRSRLARGPADNPACAMCGVCRSNEAGVGVFRYPLIRNVPRLHSNRCIGSIAICDRCVVEYAAPSPTYVRANGGAWTPRSAA